MASTPGLDIAVAFPITIPAITPRRSDELPGRHEIGSRMQKILATGFVLLLLLTGCGEDVNPVIGKWRGKITEEQRKALLIPKGEIEGILVAEFAKHHAILNGQSYRVQNKKNKETYYVNEIGTNRTMAARFPEPDRMTLTIPHRFKAEIILLNMTKVAVTQ
jgi:hypothetical protein